MLTQFLIDCFLLDDGFQHLALHRDTDLVLVDATDRDGLRALFPAGRLREPLSAISRATALVITRADAAPDWRDSLVPLLERAGSNQPRITVGFTVEKLVETVTGQTQDAGSLNGKTALAFSAIASPWSFRSLLIEHGVKLLGERVFPDHYVYRSQDVDEIIRLAEEIGAELILTTEKDAGKIAPLCPTKPSVYAVRLRTEIVEGKEALEGLVLGDIGYRGEVACA